MNRSKLNPVVEFPIARSANRLAAGWALVLFAFWVCETPAFLMARQGGAESPAAKAEEADRATEILVELRTLKFSRDTPLWCARMQELTEIGVEAVPTLCAELDRTKDDSMIRQLGFVLRAIGDPRAVPALIRAIPKTLVPANSDFGLTVADEDLLNFMQQNDLDKENRGRLFSFGRSVREIVAAIHRLTGNDLEDSHLFHVHLRKDPRGRELQRRLFRRQAERWSEWWELHFEEFVDDASLRKVELPKNEAQPLPPAGLGPNPIPENALSGMVLSPPEETANSGTQLMDLDTGATWSWPKEFAQVKKPDESREFLDGARGKGVDLMAVTLKTDDGGPAYALQALDMRVWEIDVELAQRWSKGGDIAEIPDRKPSSELLLHRDTASGEYDLERNAAFLCETREGGFMVIEITDRKTRIITREELEAGLDDLPAGAGFSKGVMFSLTRFADETP